MKRLTKKQKRRQAKLTIKGTGTCFEDMTHKFIEMVVGKEGRGAHYPNLFLVHGICLFKSGEPYAHAWIEMDGEAYFSAIAIEMGNEKVMCRCPREQFDREYRVQDFTRYTFNELLKHHAHELPPYENKYKKLTKDGKGKK